MKFILVYILIIQSAFGWVRPKSFDSSYIELENKILGNSLRAKYESTSGHLKERLVKDILSDKNKYVSKQFQIPKYFEKSVAFWFGIYTQYTKKQVVIHDKSDLGLIYKVLDFNELHSSSINRFAKSKIQAQLSQEYVKRLKKALIKLSRKTKRLSADEKFILKVIKSSKLKIPRKFSKRKRFFRKLSNNLRTQTGQRDMVYAGVLRAYPYEPYIKKQFKNFNLPQELLAIPFLESSFNPSANSKVAASGAWQFMPFIGNIFFPRASKYVDYRRNPVVSSLGAMHLLKQNKQILKRWDLAVPAYNSGTKHIQRAIKQIRRKRKISKKNISLSMILENYKHSHLGFASKNFFSEFLALVHVLAYKESIFPLKGLDKHQNTFTDPGHLRIYITKCSFRPKTFFRLMSKTSPRIKELNNHFKIRNHKYPKGILIVSDRKLTKRKYFQLNNKQLKKRYPKNYFRFAKKFKCKG